MNPIDRMLSHSSATLRSMLISI